MPTTIITDNTTGGDYTGTIDNYIEFDFQTTNRGSDGNWRVRHSSPIEKGLIAFPGLSNITGPVTVTSVTLELWLAAVGNSGPVQLNKLLQNWVETESTYTIYSTGNNWATLGAASSGTDFAATVSASVTHSVTLDEYKSFSTAQMATDVQDWINNGSNYGWLLTGVDSFTVFTYRGKNGADAQRPKLTVTYTSSGTTTAWLRG
jgi:hypothetical protein